MLFGEESRRSLKAEAEGLWERGTGHLGKEGRGRIREGAGVSRRGEQGAYWRGGGGT